MTGSDRPAVVTARKTSAPGTAAVEDFTYTILDDKTAVPGDRRADARRRTRLRSGKVLDSEGRFLAECLIGNRSAVGGLLRLQGEAPLPARIVLYEDQNDTIVAAAVVWRRGRDAGVRFLPHDPVPRESAMAAAMRRKFYAMRR